MRTYRELVTAIIHAMPREAEIAALSDEQIQELRKYGNTLDNLLYMQTREWKEWRAKNLPAAARGSTTELSAVPDLTSCR